MGNEAVDLKLFPTTAPLSSLVGILNPNHHQKGRGHFRSLFLIHSIMSFPFTALREVPPASLGAAALRSLEHYLCVNEM